MERLSNHSARRPSKFVPPALVLVLMILGEEVSFDPGALMAGMNSQDGLFLNRQNTKDEASPAKKLGYSWDDRRDPFSPVTDRRVEPSKPLIPSPNQRRKPDDHHSTWTLVGVMSGPKGHHAIIQNRRGRRWIVTGGSMIASGRWRVETVSPTAVVLVRMPVSGKGGAQQKERVVVLYSRP